MHRRTRRALAALVALVAALAAWSAGGAARRRRAATTFTYRVAELDRDRLRSGDLVLQRDHRDEQHLRAAHALRQHDARRSSRCSRPRGRGATTGKHVDVHAAEGREVPHRPPADAAAAKAAIERTIKLEGRSGLHLGRGQDDRDARRPDARLPPQVRGAARHDRRRRPTPPTSTTPRPGSQNLVKWFAAGHDAGTGPYIVGDVEEGQQEASSRLNAFKGYWGGWKGKHYTQRRSSGSRAAAHDAVAAAAVGRDHVRPAPQRRSCSRRRGPTAALASEQRAVVPEPARDAEHGVGPAQGRARAAGGRRSRSTTRASCRRSRARPFRASGYIPEGLIGLLPRASATSRTSRRRRRCWQQAGYGSGGKKLSLS